MIKRTDLALEIFENEKEKLLIRKNKEVTVTEIKIEEEKDAEKYGKPCGKYISIEFPSVEKISDYKEIEKEIKRAILTLLPNDFEKILVVGLGNREITCDSIGPVTAEKILATRHITKQFAEKIGLAGIKSVSVTVPNVLGKTGIEATDAVKGTVKTVLPDAVIVIDALSCTSINRIFRSIQLCNSGISPGSGIKNSRKELSYNSLGVPVIAVGVPTVVDAMTLSEEISGKKAKFETDLIVTPKDADLLIHRISEILANAINVSIQPEIEPQIVLQLV